ncbi:MAG: RNase adaptor protein RapZ [Epulopiscium sp. Nele67-Bin004]|nr:MAG: RNase adaptor protein RapZ [Epulopiscium sp. Nele67-Bin004]
MEFIIVTGMSGAGKSTAIKHFEDAGYYCIDNLPPALLTSFTELIRDKNNIYEKVALGIDIRGGTLFNDLFDSLDELSAKQFSYKILFFDCKDSELIKRFKETRRSHPLARQERIHEGVTKERKILEKVKEKSDYIIDTTYILPKDTKEMLNQIFKHNKEFKNLVITILVFGFKYGIPIDADLVFDVRFMPNPYYIKELRPHTGHDQVIIDFVTKSDVTKQFLLKLKDMIEFLIPHYQSEGKNQVVIGIGCTGGKHRSVVVANELGRHLKEHKYIVNMEYRDIDKDSKRGK